MEKICRPNALCAKENKTLDQCPFVKDITINCANGQKWHRVLCTRK